MPQGTDIVESVRKRDVANGCSGDVSGDGPASSEFRYLIDTLHEPNDRLSRHP